MENFIEIGKVINTRGLDGTMKVMPLDSVNSFNGLKFVYINGQKYSVSKVSSSKGFVFLKTKEILWLVLICKINVPIAKLATQSTTGGSRICVAGKTETN